MPTSESGTDSQTGTESTHDGSISRRSVLKGAGAGLAATGLAGCAGVVPGGGSDTFKIGVNMELSQGYGLLGGSVVNAAELRKQEINENGGLGGKEIELVVEDNQVDPSTAVEKARKLIRQDNVDMMMGPINSSQRIALADVVAENEVPLLYPIPYEGPAAPDYCNEWIFKTWQVPVQQVKPFIPWLMENHGTSFYFLGSDYTWPRKLNEIGKQEVEAGGGTVAGESYVQVNSTDFSSIIPKIESADPDVLFMDLVGSSVGAIQKQMHNRGVRDMWKEVGLAHGPAVLEGVSAEATQGVLQSQGYYQNLDNEANNQFVSAYQEEFDDVFINYITGAAYVGMSLLNQAVEDAGGTSTEDIRSGFDGVSLDNTIAGPVSVPHDYQAKVQCKIAEVDANKEFQILEELEALMPEEQCSGF